MSPARASVAVGIARGGRRGESCARASGRARRGRASCRVRRRRCGSLAATATAAARRRRRRLAATSALLLLLLLLLL
jgi:hypothetical protein